MPNDNDLHVATDQERADPDRKAKGPRVQHEKKLKAEKDKSNG